MQHPHYQIELAFIMSSDLHDQVDTAVTLDWTQSLSALLILQIVNPGRRETGLRPPTDVTKRTIAPHYCTSLPICIRRGSVYQTYIINGSRKPITYAGCKLTSQRARTLSKTSTHYTSTHELRLNRFLSRAICIGFRSSLSR